MKHRTRRGEDSTRAAVLIPIILILLLLIVLGFALPRLITKVFG